MTHAIRPVRWFSFVFLATSIVSIICWVAVRVLPPLRNEPPSFLLLPMPGITGMVAFLFYPFLHRRRDRVKRILWMYPAFVVSLALYGCYLWWLIPDGTVALIALALLAGHFYGWPALLVLLLACSLIDRFLFPGSATAATDG